MRCRPLSGISTGPRRSLPSTLITASSRCPVTWLKIVWNGTNHFGYSDYSLWFNADMWNTIPVRSFYFFVNLRWTLKTCLLFKTNYSHRTIWKFLKLELFLNTCPAFCVTARAWHLSPSWPKAAAPQTFESPSPYALCLTWWWMPRTSQPSFVPWRWVPKPNQM